MNFKKPDRLPVVEWAPYWDQTLERWYAEGLDPSMTDSSEIAEYLGFERYERIRFPARTSQCPKPVSQGAPIVTSESEYSAILPYLYPDRPFDSAALSSYGQKQTRGECVVWTVVEGFFWHPRTLLGIEAHLLAFYDNPVILHAMNSRLLEHHFKVLDELFLICVPSFVSISEDMSYNKGPMLSEEHFMEFLAPYYRRLIPFLKQHGVIPIVDSDGDVASLIPWLRAVGVEGILPLERMAGVDVIKIREDYPDFRMIGAFDKTVMSRGEAAIRAEFERLLPVMKQGGFIPSVDHQTPPDVSLENYRLYNGILKEYCQKAADSM